jgi:hypothetical protein
MRQFIVAVLAAGWLFGAEAEAAGALRCGSRLVQEGQHAAELLAACGEPNYRDSWGYPGPRGGWLADVEEWYYNFGPSQLLRVVRLRNGRISSIEADGYGYHESSEVRCEPAALVPGLSKFRLLRLCGEPLTRKASSVLRRLGDDPYRQYPQGYGDYHTAVHREEWVYNFGSRYLLRIVTLEDGRIVDVEDGARGYDPR